MEPSKSKHNLLDILNNKTDNRLTTTRCHKLSDYKATTDTIRPKIIRVYTLPELMKIHPLGLATDAKSKKGLAFPLVRFGTKIALVAAAVYFLRDIGVWGTSEDTEQLLVKIRNLINNSSNEEDIWMPPTCAAQKQIFPYNRAETYGECSDPVFCSEKFVNNVQLKWNGMVERFFTTLISVPQKVNNYVEKIALEGVAYLNSTTSISRNLDDGTIIESHHIESHNQEEKKDV
ncbi:unnamed protein product [Phyllotreta striolata]|uniref:MICOS complex subunit MIC13 n=1 Tax=Phyllotreta striolata TaxID=444603 RepID=A0A9N9TSL8_PHYSR|nr:unnamed protein product [Phyllotreta striolata]